MASTQLRDDIRQFLPPNLPDREKKNLLELADLMDDLGRSSATARGNDFYVDEKSLRKLLKKTVPREFEERCIATLAALPDSKLLRQTPGQEAPKGELRKVGWKELAAHVAQQVPAARVQDAGLDASPTQEELLRAVKVHIPDLPDDFFEPAVFRAHLDKISRETATEGAIGAERFYDPWGCLVNHLGFWGAVAAVVFVFVVIMALNASLGAVGAAFWTLFWGYMWAYGATGFVFYVIVVIVSCLIGFTPPF